LNHKGVRVLTVAENAAKESNGQPEDELHREAEGEAGDLPEDSSSDASQGGQQSRFQIVHRLGRPSPSRFGLRGR